MKCGISIFRSFGTLLGHGDTGAEGAREVHKSVHDRCTYEYERGHGIFNFDTGALAPKVYKRGTRSASLNLPTTQKTFYCLITVSCLT